MANKRLFQFLFNANPMMTLLDVKIVLGASGAVASSSGNMVSSVVQDATGRYTITFSQPFNAFLGASGCMIAASAGTGTGISSVEVTGIPNTTIQSSQIKIQTVSDAGAVANGASGSTILLQVLARNSSVSK